MSTKRKHLLILFAAQLALVAALFGADLALVAGLRMMKTKDLGIWNPVVDGTVNADLLVIGASDTKVSVDCGQLEEVLGVSCYNASLGGLQLVQLVPLLRLYLRENEPLRYLVIGVSPRVLFPVTRIHRPTTFMPFFDDDALYRDLEAIDPTIWDYRYVPLFGFSEFPPTVLNDAVRSLVGAERETTVRRDFAPEDVEYDAALAARMNEAFAVVDYTPSAEGLAALAEIEDIAREHGLRVVYFAPPLHASACGLGVHDGLAWDAIERSASRIGATVVDYCDKPYTSDDRLFSNAVHVNRRGAARVSSDLANDLRAAFQLGAN